MRLIKVGILSAYGKHKRKKQFSFRYRMLMNIIPVIDLKDHHVVMAKQGQRNLYTPVVSKLTQSSELHHVLEALIHLYNFPCFYIADLNALCQQGNHGELILQMAKQYPQKRFWVDQGDLDQHIAEQTDNIVPVLGSESLNADNYNQIANYRRYFILSLDFASDDSIMGNPLIFSETQLWPETIILMTLSRVGSGNGPDLEKLQYYLQNHPGKHFVAAGGIRNSNDLQQLQAGGIRNVLIASALHTGSINKADITRYMSSNKA